MSVACFLLGCGLRLHAPACASAAWASWHVMCAGQRWHVRFAGMRQLRLLAASWLVSSGKSRALCKQLRLLACTRVHA